MAEQHMHPTWAHAAHYAHEIHGDNTDRNRALFNHLAKNYDTFDEYVVKVTSAAAEEMRKVVDFNPESTVVMDFACGTGLISQYLAPYAKEITGIDISEGMVGKYNEKSKDPNLSGKIKAHVISLKGEEDELDGKKFDVILCSLAYHHIEDVHATTGILKFHLKPGGTLMIVDIARDDSSVEAMTHMKHVSPHLGGFPEPDVKEIFERAELIDYSYSKFTHFEMMGRRAEVFLAKGTKPV